MKKANVIQNIILFVLLLIFIFGFILAYRYQNQSIPKLSFQKEPNFNFLDSTYAYISGAVNNPGVYQINNSTRIIDLITLAKGFSENTDQNFVAEQINLSAHVEDEEHIFIPAYSDSSDTQSDSLQTEAKDNDLISINNASLSDLIQISGVGPSTAQKIIDNRPYSAIEDLLNVPGIGQATLNKVSPYVSL
ncbi:ComEA family DNA-binding protein [Candidatus Dojkabacteria bacterium]|uniref:ComEA family DNA-binding protein n=1 Tax=Candidatus Dojkabacteria bacterium TaxID=2099670 RepID=A0A955IAL4_9BACT|nr:ComEA family DNA-binding protein [Candidatus Dojkabacteria bacterium]